MTPTDKNSIFSQSFFIMYKYIVTCSHFKKIHIVLLVLYVNIFT